MDTTPALDPKAFRQALGLFATGVTIVTAQAADGTRVGVTANSFNSVSLNPPLVLWSLARNAGSMAVFSQATHWNVHVLARDQEALSNRFARAGEDKFAGLELAESIGPAPLLNGCAARFECEARHQYDGGDHVIFVGEVRRYDRAERAPLLYVGGSYAMATRMAQPLAPRAVATPSQAFTEDLLGYLLGRAHHQFMAGFRPLLHRYGLSDTDFYALSVLAVHDPIALAELQTHTGYTGHTADEGAMRSLAQRGWVQSVTGEDATPQPAGSGQAWGLTEEGRRVIQDVLSGAKAVETRVLGTLGEMDAASLRNGLKRLVAATDPGLPALWPEQPPSQDPQ